MHAPRPFGSAGPVASPSFWDRVPGRGVSALPTLLICTTCAGKKRRAGPRSRHCGATGWRKRSRWIGARMRGARPVSVARSPVGRAVLRQLPHRGRGSGAGLDPRRAASASPLAHALQERSAVAAARHRPLDVDLDHLPGPGAQLARFALEHGRERRLGERHRPRGALEAHDRGVGVEAAHHARHRPAAGGVAGGLVAAADRVEVGDAVLREHVQRHAPLGRDVHGAAPVRALRESRIGRGYEEERAGTDQFRLLGCDRGGEARHRSLVSLGRRGGRSLARADRPSITRAGCGAGAGGVARLGAGHRARPPDPDVCALAQATCKPFVFSARPRLRPARPAPAAWSRRMQRPPPARTPVIPLRRPVDPLFRALCCSALAALAGSPAACAQPADSTAVYQHAWAPQAVAAHLDGSIRVDGALEEAAWAAATPVTAFTQTDPEEGKPCSERTEVRFLIGDDALYIGARMFDREPAKIKARLSRRDDPVETDAFDVWLDSYHDHLTARRFRVNPAGAILDASICADGNEDDSWDAVWEAAARVDSLGWTAELRIPLSQLRYNTQQEATWGLQLARTIFRRGEFALFAFTPKKERGGVARRGHLPGVGLLPKQRRLEVVPYLSSRNEHLDVPPGDPFRTRNDFFGATGGDLKYGLTSDLTLDLTVNPDFGQVEVDPAEVNLTAFETLFPERRPFFIEGSDLFAFGRSRAFNNFSVPTVFNSRRIGRSPQLVLGGSNFNSVNAPQQTTIAGAARLTGLAWKGGSVGVLDAVATRENADYVDPAQIQRQAEVDPETHYFTGRVRRDLRAGNTPIRALAT